MIRVWIRTPTGYEIELSGDEMKAFLSEDWMEKEVGDIAQSVYGRLGLPVKVEETSTYWIGHPA